MLWGSFFDLASDVDSDPTEENCVQSDHLAAIVGSFDSAGEPRSLGWILAGSRHLGSGEASTKGRGSPDPLRRNSNQSR